MIKKWEYYEADEKELEKVMSENNISELLARILINRNLKEVGATN